MRFSRMQATEQLSTAPFYRAYNSTAFTHKWIGSFWYWRFALVCVCLQAKPRTGQSVPPASAWKGYSAE